MFDRTWQPPDEPLYSVAFAVPLDANPSWTAFVDAVLDTGEWKLAKGVGRETFDELFAAPATELQVAELGRSFRGDPVDESLPMLLLHTPDLDEDDEDAGEAFTTTPTVDDDEDDAGDETGNDTYTSRDLTLVVRTFDAEVARSCFRRFAPLAHTLHLHHAVDRYGDTLVESDVESLMDDWRRWREEIEDRRSISLRDGSVRADRVLGLQQRSVDYGFSDEMGQIIDVDIDSAERLTILAEEPTGDALTVWRDGAPVQLPQASTRWGKVWRLPDDGFALFGSSQPDQPWDRDTLALFTPEGEMRGTATVPEGLVAVTDRHLFIGYDDEQIFSADEYGRSGAIAVDFDGTVTMRYFADVEGALPIDDVYAATHVNGDVVAFYAYESFSLVLLDLVSHTQTVIEMPQPEGFSALTIDEGVAYLHAPYDSAGVFRWQIGSPDMEMIGVFPDENGLVGLPRGRFYAVGTHGYTIVTPEPPSDL
jgi:hypothetical protein